MGMNGFAPFQKRNTSFVVKNIISNSNKEIKIFNYPIPVGKERDLLAIPGVSESDIRASLLKGELLNKLLANEITIVFSDINLLQFNEDQKAFLKACGVDFGTTVSTSQLSYIKKEDVQLVGVVDGVNNIFTIPFGTFVQDADHKIIVYKNGVKQMFLDDYFIFEGGGPGTGYTGIIMVTPPSTTPSPVDVITADYYIKN